MRKLSEKSKSLEWKNGLDTLRAMAIILVLFFHLDFPKEYFWSSFYELIHTNFNKGVELFFVLSGFLISGHWFASIKNKENSKSQFCNFYIKEASESYLFII